MYFHHRRSNNKVEAFILIMAILFISGYLMNFQNLWEYWPASNQFNDVSMHWILSIVGVFIAPMGTVTGWAF